MKITPRRLLIGIVVLAGAGGIGYVAAQLAGAQSEQPEPGEGPLLTGSRTNLSVCVDGADGLAVSDQRVQEIRQALEDALAAHEDVPAEFDSPTVSRGCPPASAAFGEAIGSDDIEGRGVDAPSVHRIFLYLVRTDLYAATFPNERYARASEEFVCELDDCSPVTIGLYLAESADSSLLQDALLDGLDLVSRTPAPQPTIDWSACLRGERPHPDITCDQYQPEKHGPLE